MSLPHKTTFSLLKMRLLKPVAFASTAAQATEMIQCILEEKIEKQLKLAQEFRKAKGKEKLEDVTINSMYHGMMGLNALVYETSVVDPDKGVHYRGVPLAKCLELLPKADGGTQPLPEGIFYLLLTGDIPTKEQVKLVSADLANRAVLPKHVCVMLNNLPSTLDPITQLSCAVTIMSHDSCFVKGYKSSIKKTEYWKYSFLDSMDLIARLPVLAANIYRNVYKESKGNLLFDPEADWSANFAKMLGLESDEFVEFLRLFLTVHSDHDGGNVSAHATHLVGSALSDCFLAFGAGLNGLAGHLHGGAISHTMNWIKQMQTQIGENPSSTELKCYILSSLEKGHVIPGYGHPFLKVVDPRFLTMKNFAHKHFPDDPYIKLINTLSEVVPPTLLEAEVTKNPHPNTFAISGALFNHYGLKDTKFYPVILGTSRALGTMASTVWARAMRLAIERPKSMSTDDLEQYVCEKAMHP